MNHRKNIKDNWCLVNIETGEIYAMNKDRNVLFSLGFELMKFDEHLLLAVL